MSLCSWRGGGGSDRNSAKRSRTVWASRKRGWKLRCLPCIALHQDGPSACPQSLPTCLEHQPCLVRLLYPTLLYLTTLLSRTKHFAPTVRYPPYLRMKAVYHKICQTSHHETFRHGGRVEGGAHLIRRDDPLVNVIPEEAVPRAERQSRGQREGRRVGTVAPTRGVGPGPEHRLLRVGRLRLGVLVQKPLPPSPLGDVPVKYSTRMGNMPEFVYDVAPLVQRIEGPPTTPWVERKQRAFFNFRSLFSSTGETRGCYA